MTRDELTLIFADVIGLRLTPVEFDTLLTAVDIYVEKRLQDTKGAIDA